LDIKNSILKRNELIFMLIIVALFSLFLTKHLKNKDLDLALMQYENEIHLWKERYINFANKNPGEISTELLVMDVDGIQFNLRDKLKNEKHTIVFIYNDRSCKPCIIDLLDVIKTGQKKGY
jgi:hypothetical protein